MATTVYNANREWTQAENTTASGGKITTAVASEPGNQHIVRFIRAKSDLSTSTVTVKTASTVLATFDVGAAEKALSVYLPANRSDAVTVELTVTTAGTLSVAGETKV